MSLNGKKVSEFTADAYLNGEFVKVSDKDCLLYTSDAADE